MKIIHISDTHNQHYDLLLPPSDILIHSGDFTIKGSIRATEDFIDWFSKQDAKYKILICGNHDLYPYIYHSDFKKLCKKKGIIYLYCEEVEIEGIRIYGCPIVRLSGTPAFTVKTERELSYFFNKMPYGLDILVTHMPPLGILDLSSKNYGMKNFGSESLRSNVLLKQPKYHLFGHIHPSYGRIKYEGIEFLNSSLCDNKNKIVNKYQEIIIE